MNRLPNTPLGKIIRHIFFTGQITRADEVKLLTLAHQALLSHEEIQLVRAVSDRLQMGLLKVVD
jgi:hypothetical protein